METTELTPQEPSRKHVGRTTGKPLTNPLGRGVYGDSVIAPYLAEPLESKGQITRNEWAITAYVLSLRAKQLARTFGKKDVNTLKTLILSAAIAFDKAFPKVDQVSSKNLVVTMFGSLGADAVKRITQGEVPSGQAVVDATYSEVTSTVDTPRDTSLGGDA